MISLIVEPGGVDRLEPEVLGADLEPRQHVGPRDLIQRTRAGDGVVAGHLAKPQVVAIDPDARDPRLAPHHLILARPMHGHHDVAAALGGAEQDHVGADERGGDRDQMVRQVRDQGLRPGGGAARQDREPPGPRAGGRGSRADPASRMADRAQGVEVLGRGDQVVAELAADREHDQRQQDAQLLAAQPGAGAGAELRADDAADDQRQRQDDVDRVVVDRVQDRWWPRSRS